MQVPFPMLWKYSDVWVTFLRCWLILIVFALRRNNFRLFSSQSFFFPFLQAEKSFCSLPCTKSSNVEQRNYGFSLSLLSNQAVLVQHKNEHKKDLLRTFTPDVMKTKKAPVSAAVNEEEEEEEEGSVCVLFLPHSRTYFISLTLGQKLALRRSDSVFRCVSGGRPGVTYGPTLCEPEISLACIDERPTFFSFFLRPSRNRQWETKSLCYQTFFFGWKSRMCSSFAFKWGLRNDLQCSTSFFW